MIRKKMALKDRAKIFLPFNALTGYYELVRKEEKTIEPKRILSEEELDELSSKINMISKGDLVKLRYYKVDGYVSIEGLVAKIDDIYKNITIVDTKINFSDIVDIYCERINTNSFPTI